MPPTLPELMQRGIDMNEIDNSENEEDYKHIEVYANLNDALNYLDKIDSSPLSEACRNLVCIRRAVVAAKNALIKSEDQQ